ncbi:glycerophosphodiester phosphodiesterase [Oenococcus oeni]|uniref:glycerophosphodiester phosphodiesterase n=1 Tax=Oenococcus oeni TaxID=1247 RepID=UPI0011D0CC15|nr:glycerophosphodiester phosphodiesterase [Oenococcus oeni]
MPKISSVLNWSFPNWSDLFTKQAIDLLAALACYALIWFAFVILIQLFFFYFLRIRDHRDHCSDMKLKVFNPGIHLICLLFLIAGLPLANVGYKLPLVTLIKLPYFIVQTVIKNIFLLIVILLVVMFFWLFIIKLFQTIPAIMSGKSFLDAVRYSWSEMSSKKIRHLSLVFLINLIVLLLLIGLVFCIQTLADHLSFFSARVSANLLIVFFTGLLYGATYELLRCIFRNSFSNQEKIFAPFFEHNISIKQILLAIVSIIGIGLISSISTNNFFPVINRRVLIISHKGSNGNNGVPNSLQSLKSTSRLKPNYIEVDVRYTKDHQFVVMHDDNLKSLIGKNLKPEQATLEQLEKITMKAVGHQTKITSFQKYTNYAWNHGQKLLVEIKTPSISQKYESLSKVFLSKYGKSLVKHHDLIHSLNQGLINSIHKKDPNLKVGFIISYNTESLPHKGNNFYTIEYSTLDNELVGTVHRQGKRIFAWTADDDLSMYWLSVMNVDGIITDYPQRLKAILRTPRRFDYNKALLFYMLNIRQIY